MKWRNAKVELPEHNHPVIYKKGSEVALGTASWIDGLRSTNQELVWLDESQPIDIKEDAKRLYPTPKHIESAKEYLDAISVVNLQRFAHISCALSYQSRLKELEARATGLKQARDAAWRCFKDEKNNHIKFADECEKAEKRIKELEDRNHQLMAENDALSERIGDLQNINEALLNELQSAKVKNYGEKHNL